VRLKRLVTVLAVVLVVVVGLAVAAVGWVGTSTSGARFVLERVIAATGGALTVGELDGSLSEALVLSDLRYRDAAHEVAIDRVALRVDLFALAGRVLVVDDLRSSVVRYRALGPAPAPAAAAGEPLTLPLTLRVDRASIEGISIARDEGSLELERIVIAGAAEDTTALLQRLELRVADVFLSMQGALACSSHSAEWAIDIDEGTKDAPNWEVTVSTAFESRTENKQSEQEVMLESDIIKVTNVLQQSGKLAKSDLRNKAGISQTRFNKYTFPALIERGVIEEIAGKRANDLPPGREPIIKLELGLSQRQPASIAEA
jgi:autotransporter translocation and assembly factor TamB